MYMCAYAMPKTLIKAADTRDRKLAASLFTTKVFADQFHDFC